MTRIAVLVLILGACLAPLAWAQAPTVGPSPELKQWDFWLGDWTMTGIGKDSATEPEYKLVWKMNCRRILADFYIEASSTWTGNGRVVNALEVLYYDPVRKIHAYSGFDSGGTTWVATVKFGERTFTEIETDTGPDGKITTMRNTWTLSPDGMSISGRQEAEQDGVRWTSFTVKGTKTKPAPANR